MKKYIIILILLLSTIGSRAQKLHTFDNHGIKAIINLDNASLIQFEDKNLAWNIIPQQKSARAFDLILKLEDGRIVTIDEKGLPAPKVSIAKDALTFKWDEISVDGKSIAVSFEGTIKLTAEGLVYGGIVDNRSNIIVEKLSWPYIGEFSMPQNTSRLVMQYLNYTKLDTQEMFPRTTDYHGGSCNFPEHSFALINNEQQGLYISSKDTEIEELIRCKYEILPTDQFAAYVGGTFSKVENGERRKTKITVRTEREIFTFPKNKRVLMDVVMKPYKGTWHKGADIYKEWRKTWYKTPHRAEWIDNVNAWQQVQISGSEDFINFKYKDLVDYAKEAKEYGVDAIQLTGWHIGGQDRNVPLATIDPRLGTHAEFKKAIAQSQAMGVKILLFTKFTWSDLTSPMHKKFEKHIAKNIFGEPAIHPGYNYYSYTQLLGLNTERFGVFCMVDKDLRNILKKEFQKVLDLGAAGQVYDENQHHAGHQLCFDPNHGHKIPASLYKGADLFGHDFTEMVKKQNPDFVSAGEGCYDLQSKYYITYTRADVYHNPGLRYVDSEMPIACAVIDHFDKNRINMCLMNKYAMSYESRSFKGKLSEFPRMVNYGKTVDDLRKRYPDYLWDAEFRHTQDAVASGRDIVYTVFKKENGKKAIVILNASVDNINTASLKIEQPQGKLVFVSPENPEETTFGGAISMQPQSVIVVMEK